MVLRKDDDGDGARTIGVLKDWTPAPGSSSPASRPALRVSPASVLHSEHGRHALAEGDGRPRAQRVAEGDGRHAVIKDADNASSSPKTDGQGQRNGCR